MTNQSSRSALSRRDIMISAGLAMAFPGLAGATVRTQRKGRREDLELWYGMAAGPWVEALPVGNGRTGAMVFGRVAQERIQLNEASLYAGGPYDPLNPAMPDALPKVRDLIDAGDFKAASDLADRDMIAKPRTQMPFGAAGDLLLSFKGLSRPSAYRRALSLDDAVATTRFVCGKARYSREVFASAPDGVVIVRLAADQGTLDFDLDYRHPRDVKYGETRYNGGGDALAAAGTAWDYAEPVERTARPPALSIEPDGAAALLVEGRNIASAGIDGALRYAVRIAATGDGAISATGDRIEVRGATAVTLVIATATSHVNFHDTSGDPVAAVRARGDAAARKPYARLKADHLADHRALFRRLSIRLGDGAAPAEPANQRIATAETAPDPAQAALYVQYARYLLISSSRPGGQPANLQGIWNEGTNPPWGSKYTININTEMNYWPAGPANLGACVEPVLRMVEDLAVTGAATARRGYNARGWVAHHNTDLWRASAPIDGALWGVWPMGGAWLCMTLWTQYGYTPDEAFLKRLYPLLKGASLFFVDTLVEDPKGRGLVTSPSLSPENIHPGGVALCAGPAMDRQILRDLFAATLSAHALSQDPDADFVRIVQEKRARLPADRIGAQGQLQEWLDDWDARAPEQQHRHVSHLYGVYPSGQINVRDTPDLIAAAKTTLNVRGDKSTGWATAWRLALWARMGEGDRAHAILLGLLGPSRTYPNMFDAHPPFQIDGNFGGCAGILEMIVQSWGDEIRLLPALPSAWPEGALYGAGAKGGIEVDLEWSRGRLTHAILRGRPGSRIAVRYTDALATLSIDRKGSVRFI